MLLDGFLLFLQLLLEPVYMPKEFGDRHLSDTLVRVPFAVVYQKELVTAECV